MTVSSYYYLPWPGEPLITTREGELLRVALALNAGMSVEEISDVLFEHLDGLVPFDRLGVAILQTNGVLTLAHVRSKVPIFWGKGASARLAGTSLEPIVRERRIRVISDLAQYLTEHPGSRTAPLLLREGMMSSLTLPLSTPEGVVGLVFFSSTHPNAYHTEHVDFLRSLAAGLGIAFERGRLLDELRRTNDELKTLDELKTNFMSNLSHELRTPLSEVMGNAYALDDTVGESLTAEHRVFLSAVIAGAEQLKSLLNDLFDYTALEAGKLVLNTVPVDVGGLVSELAEEWRDRVAEQGLELTVAIPREPLWVMGDPPRLAQVFRALLDNACKFTPAPGGIQIRASESEGDVLVEVSDTGIGIPPEYHERVFDKFFQVESGAGRRYGGAGLGLALAKAIVVAHKGMLMMKSIPGQGTLMSVLLPWSEPDS